VTVGSQFVIEPPSKSQLQRNFILHFAELALVGPKACNLFWYQRSKVQP